jgi:hypothetical protein
MVNSRNGWIAVLGAVSVLFGCDVAAEDCSVAVLNKPGDLIRVTAILQTDDPNENGEGEPVVFTSLGGELSETLELYSSPHAYAFIARVPNESISGNVVNGDGDETCTLVASVNEKTVLSDAEKEYLSEESAKHAVLSVGAAVVAELCLEGVVTARVCALPMAEFAVEFGIGAVAGGKYAFDPPDPNYTVIAVPASPIVTLISPQSGLPQGLVDTANALQTGEGQLTAIELALVTTLNRVSGAVVANDQLWVQRQTANAQLLKVQLAGHLSHEADLLAAFNSSLTAAGLTVEITSDDVLEFESDVAFNGLPDDELAALARFGADDDIIASAAQLTFVQDATAVAAFPETLAEPALLSLLRKAPEILYSPHRRAITH